MDGPVASSKSAIAEGAFVTVDDGPSQAATDILMTQSGDDVQKASRFERA